MNCVEQDLMILDQYNGMLRCPLQTDGGFSPWSGGWVIEQFNGDSETLIVMTNKIVKIDLGRP